jgi:hypothetical protein
MLLMVAAHDVRQAGQAQSILAQRGGSDVHAYRIREGG